MYTRITISGTNYDSDKIYEATYTHTVNSGQQLNIGVVAAAQLKFKTAQQFAVGTTLTYYSKPKSTSSYTKIGMFTIKAVDVQVTQAIPSKLYTYTCYDNCSKFDTIVDGWFAARTYPVTLSTMFSTLCSFVGVSGNNSFDANAATVSTKPFSVTNLNGKTVLGWIAQIAGGYAYADADGTIRIRHYATSGAVAALTYQNYTQISLSNFQVKAPTQIRTVKNAAGEVDIYGSGNPMIKISGNPLAYSSCSNAIAYIHNILSWMIAYTPLTIHLLEDYGIKAGDRITVDGITTIVMTKKIDKSGVTLSSTGVETRQEETELQNDFVSMSYLQENKITVDTTNYGFVVNNGSEQSRLTPTQFVHDGPGNREAAINGYGLRWFDSNSYLRLAAGEYLSYKGLMGLDTSGNVTSMRSLDATDDWGRVRDTNNVEKTNQTSSGTPREMGNPPANLYRAVKGFVLELTDSTGTTVYASTTFFAWPYGSSTIEESTSSATQTIVAAYVNYSNTRITATCYFNFNNFKYQLFVSDNSYYARLRYFF